MTGGERHSLLMAVCETGGQGRKCGGKRRLEARAAVTVCEAQSPGDGRRERARVLGVLISHLVTGGERGRRAVGVLTKVTRRGGGGGG